MPKHRCLNLVFISAFPNAFTWFANHSIIKKAITNHQLVLVNLDLRTFTEGKQRQIDDYQYGPGKGMVLKVEPIAKAIQAAQQLSKTKRQCIILLTPQGQVFDQQQARTFAQEYDEIILIAGHYEGFDERVRTLVDFEISLGDYILSNGELSAMVIADAIIRLRPNVIPSESQLNESFQAGLLDYPVYTKPLVFAEQAVPAILLSGHHAKIAAWRKTQALIKTARNRPDLLIKRRISKAEITILKTAKLWPLKGGKDE